MLRKVVITLSPSSFSFPFHLSGPWLARAVGMSALSMGGVYYAGTLQYNTCLGRHEPCDANRFQILYTSTYAASHTALFFLVHSSIKLWPIQQNTSTTVTSAHSARA